MSPILATRAGVSAIGYGMFGNNIVPTAFESIASATGTGSSGTITFSSIPSTYSALQIRGSFLTTSAVGDAVEVTFNGVGGTSYARHYLRGNGTAASAAGLSSIAVALNMFPNGLGTSAPSVCIVDVHNYASTSQNKTVRALEGQEDNTNGMLVLESGLFVSTNAITSITLTASSGGSFTTTTSVALYGIKGA